MVKRAPAPFSARLGIGSRGGGTITAIAAAARARPPLVAGPSRPPVAPV